jgi:diaminopimelate decarboxylase
VSGFAYRDGILHVEELSLEEIADEVGTPTYIYAANAIRARFRAFRDAFRHRRALFCYALKANSNLAIIRLLAAEGAGADTVSGGEIARALAAGVPPRRIVLAGIGKTDEEIRQALAADILQLNVESVPELLRIDELARGLGRQAPVALRINPDVAADTHDHISTGRRDDKFGIAYDQAPEIYRLAAGLPGIAPVGLHIHIGSQITKLGSFERAYARAADLFRALQSEGLPLRRLDLGGGFGVRYRDEQLIDPRALASLVDRLTGALDCDLIFEPGRLFVAEAGVLLARVIYLKETVARRFLVLDTGMNNLIRPMLYGARHEILPVREPGTAELLSMDVVGPICESTDVFARGQHLPRLARGDLVAFMGAGAYGAVMGSNYNSRPSAAEVLVDRDRQAVIKPRRLAPEQFADEVIPAWVGAPVAGDA